jgi:hypothetical protein
VFDSVPLSIFFLGTIALVLGFTEIGYRAGLASHRAAPNEKSAPASGVSAAVLGLAAFMLAFAFGSVASRYDARKELVRDDANAIRTAYARADFLPDADRAASRRLLVRYLDERIAFAQAPVFTVQRMEATRRSSEIQFGQLWGIAVANARKDMNSDVAALYIESLNDLAAINATRIAVGAQMRLPPIIWIALVGLTALGMAAAGYHTGIDDSQRSRLTVVLAIAFATVILMLAALDRPHGFVRVTQQPLVDLRQAIGGVGPTAN